MSLSVGRPSSFGQRLAAPVASPLTWRDRRGATNVRRCDDDILDTLRAEFGGYCEALFERLARFHPTRLARLVSEAHLSPGKLTYAAEALGSIVDEHLAVRTLLPLLRTHPSPMVREGAVYGLVVFAHRTDVRQALEHAAQHDPSPGVREAASGPPSSDV